MLQIIGSFQAFTQAFIVSGGTGGPSDSTLFYTLYLYQRGFGHFDMGYASAMAWMLLVIIARLHRRDVLASQAIGCSMATTEQLRTAMPVVRQRRPATASRMSPVRTSGRIHGLIACWPSSMLYPF